MRSLMVVLVVCAGVARGSLVQAADMSVTQEKSTAVIRRGDEIVAAYRHGKDSPKPYLIAVSAPGALELLVSEIGEAPADEFAPGNKVFVAVETAALQDAPGGKPAGKIPFGGIVSVTAAQDGWLQVAGGQAWIAARDIVPIKAMVTRVVDLDPPTIKERPHPMYYDHPHHKGVWNSVDEVSGVNFWNEDGRIETVSVNPSPAAGDVVGLDVINHWIGADGKPLLEEKARITVDADRLFTYEVTFTAQATPVTFEDTKEGMFAIRLRNSMRELVAKGPVVNSDGREGTKACWGRTAAWVDYVGPIGRHNFGVTVMDHPDNPRKSRYHVRDYGLFAINPFGDSDYTRGTDAEAPPAPLTLKPGESVRFRYGLYVHRGDAQEGKVAEAYARFAQPGNNPPPTAP
jgi:hypothetical protein